MGPWWVCAVASWSGAICPWGRSVGGIDGVNRVWWGAGLDFVQDLEDVGKLWFSIWFGHMAGLCAPGLCMSIIGLHTAGLSGVDGDLHALGARGNHMSSLGAQLE